MKIKCKKCQKIDWFGCGKHLEYLFANIEYRDRCWCGYSMDEAGNEEIKKLIKAAKKKKSYGPFPRH